MTAVNITGLTKRYGGLVAIDNIDLSITDGELVSLLGPSGCGKTTTLRSIAGFVEPDSGSILFDGHDITRLPPEHRDIGMVFQNYALFPHMTVWQNLSFGLEMRKVPQRERERRIGEVLDVVQLTGLSERYPRQLSGGQQQRVALARGLVIEPKVLLLDEPLANLDAQLREEMRFFIRSLQKRVGITTVYVTHDQAEAMAISDRIVVMSKGRISQLGNAEDIYMRPSNREVAGFIGITNFIDGVIARDSEPGACWLDTPLGSFQCQTNRSHQSGTKATIILRPEAVTISHEEQKGPDINGFAGTVSARIYQGNFCGYRVRSQGLELQIQAPASLIHQPGAEVWCSVPKDKVWLVQE